MKNKIETLVVRDFGNEWTKYNQSELSQNELNLIFNEYFNIFPWNQLPEFSNGFDLGCGSGRWAKLVAPRVGKLYCVEPSSAIEIAKVNLKDNPNCIFYNLGVDYLPFEDNSMDFGYSLGVLHHIPDTLDGIKKCVKKLKSNAPFLIYLYYAFDNQPIWYRFIWKLSDYLRRLICKLPFQLKLILSQIIAFTVYLPLSKIAFILEKIGINVKSFPLSIYRNKSFYTMKTDALDRFGTKLEHRFTKFEIYNMLTSAGLDNIIFSNSTPFWVAVGYKK